MRAFHKLHDEGAIVRSAALTMMCVLRFVYRVWHGFVLVATIRPTHTHTSTTYPITPPNPTPPHPPIRRVWRTWSVATGSDVTWGALGHMARALEVTPAELEGPELLACGLPGAKG